MQGVELALTAVEGVLAGTLQHLLGAGAEIAAEVDRPLGTRTLPREVASQELVERAPVVAGLGSEVFGHSVSPET